MSKYEYDVFVSFAFEDKEAIAEPLVCELKKRGISVWYSSYNLKLGDSITDEILKGLTDSRYRVVILSPTYFQKGWAMAELKALFAQETIQNKKRILPIWHKLTYEEVVEHYSLLADRYAVSSDLPVPQIADKIQAVIEERETDIRANGHLNGHASAENPSG